MAAAVKEASGGQDGADTVRSARPVVSNIFYFHPLFAEDFQFDQYFNHQLEYIFGMGFHMAKTTCNNHFHEFV